MEFEYEFIRHQKGLPFRAYFVNVGDIGYHWHGDVEYMLVLKGSVILQDTKGLITLNRGDIYIINTYDTHNLRHNGEDNLLLGIQVEPSVTKDYLWPLSEMVIEESHLIAKDSRSKVIGLIMAELMLRIDNEGPENLLLSSSNIYRLLAKTLELIPYKKLNKNLLRIKENEFERLKSIITYINDHYVESIRLQNLADRYYISKYHLSHFIKDKLGIGFQDLLNRIRLQHAIKGILDTEKTIISIAVDCGFSDVKYLNKLVKIHYDVTPMQLRQNYREEDINKLMYGKDGHRPFDKDYAFELLEAYIKEVED